MPVTAAIDGLGLKNNCAANKDFWAAQFARIAEAGGTICQQSLPGQISLLDVAQQLKQQHPRVDSRRLFFIFPAAWRR